MISGNNWEWALKQIKAGKKVCRWVWQTRYVFAKFGNEIASNDGYLLTPSDYEADDWGPNDKLKDLKVGQKWRLTMSPDMPTRMIVSEPYGYGVKRLWYVELSTGKLYHTSLEDMSHVTILS